TPRPQASAAPGVRWWPALVILLLVALGIAYVLLFSPLGPGWRFWASVGVGFLGVLGLMFWALLFSRLPWVWRLAGFLAPLVLIVGFGLGYYLSLYRFGEFDGDSVPVWSSFTWGWHRTSAQRMAEITAPARPVNLRLATTASDYPQFQGPQRDGILRGIR